MYAQNYKVDAIQLAMQVCVAPKIEIIEFDNIKICGLLYKGDSSTTIGLNARRSAGGRNFDCMHELMHYWLHNDKDSFYCLDGMSSHIEWQANEGAAQFLMPYQSFIPNYCYLHDKLYAKYMPQKAYEVQVSMLANSYMVGEMSIKIRMKSLKNEIAQYIDGASINKIKIVPNRHKQV